MHASCIPRNRASLTCCASEPSELSGPWNDCTPYVTLISSFLWWTVFSRFPILCPCPTCLWRKRLLSCFCIMNAFMVFLLMWSLTRDHRYIGVLGGNSAARFGPKSAFFLASSPTVKLNARTQSRKQFYGAWSPSSWSLQLLCQQHINQLCHWLLSPFQCAHG